MNKRMVLISVIIALVLILAAAVVWIVCLEGAEAPAQPETETTGNTQTEPEESMETTDPATEPTAPVTTPLVPDDTDYTGPTFMASEGVDDWDDTDSTTGTTPPTTKPQQPETTAPGNSDEITLLTWEQYEQLTTAEKQAYDLSFGMDDAGREAFFAWLDAAYAEYEKTHQGITGDGNIDIGDFMGNGN